jgi:hypothetical protein
MDRQSRAALEPHLYAVEEPAQQRRRRRGLPLLSALLAVGLFAAVGVYVVDRREAPEVWQDGSVNGPWLAVFDGLGTTTYDDGTITLSPRAARRPEQTHAGLVVSMKWYENVDYTVSMRTVEQLRVGRPNPWEVGWVVWHYDTNRHFYYFALKPNGWELGKVDPAFKGGQRFLATGERPAGYAARHRVRVRQIGDTMDVWVDGKPVTSYTDTDEPYLRGAVGVYCEDAVVEFSDMRVTSALAD